MPPRLRFLLVLAVFAAVLWASARVGVPQDATGHDDLPDVALGWRPLLHILRAGALLSAIGAAVMIAWRGAHGEWPVKVGQVEYAQNETDAASSELLDRQGERIEVVEAQLRRIQRRLDEQEGND